MVTTACSGPVSRQDGELLTGLEDGTANLSVCSPVAPSSRDVGMVATATNSGKFALRVSKVELVDPVGVRATQAVIQRRVDTGLFSWSQSDLEDAPTKAQVESFKPLEGFTVQPGDAVLVGTRAELDDSQTDATVKQLAITYSRESGGGQFVVKTNTGFVWKSKGCDGPET